MFESELSPASPAWLADHVIYGTPIVPATAFLELMRRAVGAGRRHRRDVVDVRIDEPLVLAGGRAVTVQTIVDDDATVEVHAETEHGWRRHAVGVAAPGLAATADGPVLAAARTRCTTAVDGAAYYGSLADLGAAYGPRLQCIEEAARRDGEVDRHAPRPRVAPTTAASTRRWPSGACSSSAWPWRPATVTTPTCRSPSSGGTSLVPRAGRSPPTARSARRRRASPPARWPSAT